MISIARIFGAPETVPAGNVALRTSIQVLSGETLPVTREAMCITWEYRTTDVSCSILPCNAHCLASDRQRFTGQDLYRRSQSHVPCRHGLRRSENPCNGNHR